MQKLIKPFILLASFFIQANVFAQSGDINKKSIKQIAAGANHCMALLTDGSLWAWGTNAGGQLGNSSTTDQDKPIQVGTQNNWAAVSAGSGFTHAIKTDGTLWGWGINKVGQLGIPTANLKYMYTVPVQIGKDRDWQAVSSGKYFTVGLKKDGTIWVWGANIYYLLPGKTNQYEPFKIADKNNKDWQDIAAGDEFFMARKHDGSIWTMGKINDKNDKQFVKVNNETDWASMDAGRLHAMAIKKDGSLWAWGANNNGQLGNGTTIESKEPVKVAENMAAVSASDNYTVAMKKNEGDVLWWGKSWMNKTAQLKPTFAQASSNLPLLATGLSNFVILMNWESALDFSEKYQGSKFRLKQF